MASATMSFRVPEEIKGYICELNVPLAKLIQDMVSGLKSGAITYGEYGFKSANTEKSAEIAPAKPEKVGMPSDIDLSELYAVASRRRATPQSVLDNALRPYRR